METPIFKALKQQNELNYHRFHTPGHKGSMGFPFSEIAPFDLTELELTGSLYESTAPFLESEKIIEEFYQSGASLISAQGSTLCIQTMLTLFCPVGSKVLMGRNSHVSAINTCALLDLHPIWLYADEASGIETGGRITPQLVDKMLQDYEDVSAVYITSPDYFGSIGHIDEICRVCHKHNKPLLVDNAHGAHLCYFGLHPMEFGADACCDSFHKTFPVLTGGAVLHLKNGHLKETARQFMSIYGSTSPSYPIMLSIDIMAGQLQKFKTPFLKLAANVEKIKEDALKKGVWATVGESDPTRIALVFLQGKRDDAVKLLKNCKIEAEYVSNRHIVLLPGADSNLECVKSLVARLESLEQNPCLRPVNRPKTAISIRQAMFSPKREIELKDACNAISAQTVAACPPGIPLIIPGEVINKDIIKNITGKTSCFVVE